MLAGISIISCCLANPAVRRDGWGRSLQHVKLRKNRIGFIGIAGSNEENYPRQHNESRRQRNFPDGFTTHGFRRSSGVAILTFNFCPATIM